MAPSRFSRLSPQSAATVSWSRRTALASTISSCKTASPSRSIALGVGLSIGHSDASGSPTGRFGSMPITLEAGTRAIGDLYSSGSCWQGRCQSSLELHRDSTLRAGSRARMRRAWLAPHPRPAAASFSRVRYAGQNLSCSRLLKSPPGSGVHLNISALLLLPIPSDTVIPPRQRPVGSG